MAVNHRATTLHRPWAVWLALCVALVMALAPTVSHALVWSHGEGGHYVEICTATGPSLVAADPEPSSAGSPAGPESALSLLHCPFCLQATSYAFAPSSKAFPLRAMSDKAAKPQDGWVRPIEARINPRQQPRGPPHR